MLEELVAVHKPGQAVRRLEELAARMLEGPLAVRMPEELLAVRRLAEYLGLHRTVVGCLEPQAAHRLAECQEEEAVRTLEEPQAAQEPADNHKEHWPAEVPDRLALGPQRVV